jgi:hypothetical protein
MDALGRIFNVVAAASGVHIPLTNAQAVTFITYEDDGSTILTLKESKQGASEAALAVMDHVWKGPGIGGTWTAATQTAAATYDLADDTANDTVVVTVNASDLSDTFDCVEMTVDGGICIAIIHDLLVKRTPANLASSVV